MPSRAVLIDFDCCRASHGRRSVHTDRRHHYRLRAPNVLVFPEPCSDYWPHGIVTQEPQRARIRPLLQPRASDVNEFGCEHHHADLRQSASRGQPRHARSPHRRPVRFPINGVRERMTGLTVSRPVKKAVRPFVRNSGVTIVRVATGSGPPYRDAIVIKGWRRG